MERKSSALFWIRMALVVPSLCLAGLACVLLIGYDCYWSLITQFLLFALLTYVVSTRLKSVSDMFAPPGLLTPILIIGLPAMALYYLLFPDGIAPYLVRVGIPDAGATARVFWLWNMGIGSLFIGYYIRPQRRENHLPVASDGWSFMPAAYIVLGVLFILLGWYLRVTVGAYIPGVAQRAFRIPEVVGIGVHLSNYGVQYLIAVLGAYWAVRGRHAWIIGAAALAALQVGTFIAIGSKLGSLIPPQIILAYLMVKVGYHRRPLINWRTVSLVAVSLALFVAAYNSARQSRAIRLLGRPASPNPRSWMGPAVRVPGVIASCQPIRAVDEGMVRAGLRDWGSAQLRYNREVVGVGEGVANAIGITAVGYAYWLGRELGIVIYFGLMGFALRSLYDWTVACGTAGCERIGVYVVLVTLAMTHGVTGSLGIVGIAKPVIVVLALHFALVCSSRLAMARLRRRASGRRTIARFKRRMLGREG